MLAKGRAKGSAGEIEELGGTGGARSIPIHPIHVTPFPSNLQQQRGEPWSTMIRALAIALLVAPSASFVAQFGSGPRAVALSAAKGKGLANDAIAVFRAKYDKPPMKIPGIFSNSMIGENSIAAEMYGKSSKSLTSTEYIPFSERPEKDLVACFNEMAKLYGGEENALKIVKAEPCSLAYNPSNFAATKKAFL